MKITDFPGTPCLELISLKRLHLQVRGDCWRFMFREPVGNAEAGRLSELLFGFYLHGEMFHCYPDFVPMANPATGGRFWLIDSEGMWLLSHLFTNWQEMYRKACPVVVEVKPTRPDPMNAGAFFLVDLATGSKTPVALKSVRMEYTIAPVQYEPAPAGTCQQCGAPFHPFDVVCVVWLKDAPLEQKRVCAACHQQLTREQKIIREAK